VGADRNLLRVPRPVQRTRGSHGGRRCAGTVDRRRRRVGRSAAFRSSLWPRCRGAMGDGWPLTRGSRRYRGDHVVASRAAQSHRSTRRGEHLGVSPLAQEIVDWPSVYWLKSGGTTFNGSAGVKRMLDEQVVGPIAAHLGEWDTAHVEL